MRAAVCSSRRRALLALLWVTAVHAIALYLFTTGFFLTRFEVPDVSDCRVPPHEPHAPHLRTPGAGDSTTDRGCWMPRRFRRVVFVVVDALRFDFVQSASTTSSTASSTSSFYLNHLPILNATLHAQPAHALLLKFVADAPTMTMQRLKGLTTGALPTFLDIKDNMASSAITEDNLLLQMNRLERPIVFMGDDTWDALYHHAFTRKYAFDSFNVKDLHSVDRGVVRHLFPELHNRHGSDLLIAHFLGVDHVGHTYGPSSAFMTEKLDEMNGILTRLIAELGDHDDTLLLVMGDHGMSADGNHGGASDDETGAALFVYSPQPLVAPDATAAAWPQEVPQVDLVPTLALLAGLPIPFGSLGAVIPQLFPDVIELVEALRLNVAQVRRYLQTYSAASKLPQSELASLEQLYETLVRLETTATTDNDKGLDDLLHAQRAYLREALALGRSIWTQFDLRGMGWGIALLLVGQGLLVWHLMGDPMAASRDAIVGALGGVVLGAVVPPAIGFLPRSLLPRMLALAALGSCVVPAVARPTTAFQRIRRPFAITSASVVAFVTVLLHALALLSNSYIVSEDRVMQFLSATAGTFLMWSAQRHAATPLKSQAIGAAAVFVVVSRVLSAVEPPHIIQSTTSLWRTWLPLALLVIGFVFLQRHRLRHPSLHVVVSLLAVVWASVACALYWYGSPIASSFWRLGLPRSVFLLAIISLVLQARNAWSTQTAPTDSAFPLQLLLMLLLLVYALVLGPSSPLTVLCLVLQHASFVRVASLCCGNRPLPLAWVWLWCAVCYQAFFTTGHCNTFSSLQNAAAFVGVDDFRFYWAGVLLGWNTFGHYALALLALGSRPQPGQALLAVVAYFALNTLVSTAFVALQRRHLMVWAIFAPKFIFDSATLLVVELFALLSLALVTSTNPPITHIPLK